MPERLLLGTDVLTLAIAEMRGVRLTTLNARHFRMPSDVLVPYQKGS